MHVVDVEDTQADELTQLQPLEDEPLAQLIQQEDDDGGDRKDGSSYCWASFARLLLRAAETLSFSDCRVSSESEA